MASRESSSEGTRLPGDIIHSNLASQNLTCGSPAASA
ncbi:hypothetical protein CCACVL1_14002 [Corchorus capsularis]|uniref:Uncharacterized protein n=1 Tax=Corchorus capsularis TaxID=210143 RepID=A0A1R3I8M2_COCAP|nr:hypothetical protein CCACVL1_14002 [Corchorus capsularis]